MVPWSLLHPRHALGRLALSAIVGALVFLAAAPHLVGVTAFLLAMDAAGLTLLGLAWSLLGTCDASVTRARAAEDDPGRTLVYVIVLLTSLASLISATLLVGTLHGLEPGSKQLTAALCLLAVVLAWALTHTTFTLRYAHLYYREDDEGVGGVEFPGGDKPTYFDFAYFAFTVGMCFQVSDMTVSSSQIRRTVLFHAIISFAYNSILLAFVLNLVFGAV